MSHWRDGPDMSIIHRMRSVVLLVALVACSSDPGSAPPSGIGGSAGEANGGAAGVAGQSFGGAAGVIGTGGEGAVWHPPFECWEGCTPLSAFAVGSPPCVGLDQAACTSFTGAWVYEVPACGKPQLWVSKCTWLGAACGSPSLEQRFQTCVQ